MIVTIEISENDAKDLDTAVTQILKQVGGIVININGLMKLSSINTSIQNQIKEKENERK